IDPCELMLKEATEKKIKIDGIINLSASPFDVSKKKKRLNRAEMVSLELGCPFFYLNRVGGEDEIIFDGTSFVTAGSKLVILLKSFEADLQQVILEDIQGEYQKKAVKQPENTWEGLFAPRLDQSQKMLALQRLSDEECASVLEAL